MSRWRRPNAEQQQGFERFVLQHGRALGALARGLTTSGADAEDLLQEVLAKALERWERVEAAEAPYPYVRRMMVNASTSTWRRLHREQHPRSAEHVARDRGDEHALWGPPGEGGGEEALDERMATVELLSRLPSRQRAVVVLRYLEDVPDPQIAELLGMSPGTVRSTALRALRSLRVLTAASD